MSKVLIIDNYDSFVYNLVRYVGELGYETYVKRNDKITTSDIINISPSHIILSPGPGTPEKAGKTIDIIKKFGITTPILGVCLGHQAIAVAYGGLVIKSSFPQHGKSSIIKHNRTGVFQGLKPEIEVGRYHSLIVSSEEIPDNINITAWSSDGEIMALQHDLHPVYGVQFHPESILTPYGKLILKNFLRITYASE